MSAFSRRTFLGAAAATAVGTALPAPGFASTRQTEASARAVVDIVARDVGTVF